jgi:hypothetical protein
MFSLASKKTYKIQFKLKIKKASILKVSNMNVVKSVLIIKLHLIFPFQKEN